MRKRAVSAGSGGTTIPFLNETEGTFQTPGSRCNLKALRRALCSWWHFEHCRCPVIWSILGLMEITAGISWQKCHSMPWKKRSLLQCCYWYFTQINLNHLRGCVNFILWPLSLTSPCFEVIVVCRMHVSPGRWWQKHLRQSETFYLFLQMPALFLFIYLFLHIEVL